MPEIITDVVDEVAIGFTANKADLDEIFEMWWRRQGNEYVESLV